MAIRVRRGTDVDRLSVILDQGEIAYTTDTKKFYVGDGVTPGGNEIGGAGLPPGGTTGQLLAKIDGTDYNTEWIDNYANWTSQLKHEVKAGEVISKGQAVYVSGADGTNMIVSKASNASESTSSKTMGLLAQSLASGGKGFLITEGLLSGVDTSTATAGDPVWLGVNGNLIYGLAGKPVAPAHLVFIGIVTRVNNVNGEIFIKVQNGFELEELHNVSITSVVNNDVVAWDSATNLWKNKSVATALGYVPVNAGGSYANPSWIASLAWGKITGTPTTLSGYGITDAVNTGGSYANPTWLTSLAWGKITSTPTTLAGYGITDGVSTSGSYSNPSWITDLAFSKITGYSVPTLAQVTTAGATTTNLITVGGVTANGSVTASAAIAMGNYINNTLVASANNDVLVGLDMNPTYNNGAFTGVANYGLRVTGTGTLAYFRNSSGGITGATQNGVTISVGASGNGLITSYIYTPADPTNVISAGAAFGLNGSTSNFYGIGLASLRSSRYDMWFQTGGSNGGGYRFYRATTELFTIFQSGNVGINQTTDAGFRLDVNGTARIQNQLTTTGTITAASAIARGVYFNQTLTAAANNDVLVGLDITPTFTTGSFTGVTSWSIRTSTDISVNSVRVGLGSGAVITNTVMGNGALNSNSTGSQNTAVGYQVLAASTGNNNTAVGYQAGIGNTTGLSNTIFGALALTSNSTGSANTALGFQSGLANTTGNLNTFIGNLAGSTNTTGIANVAIGSTALRFNISGGGNIAIGYNALNGNSASNNTAVGFEAGVTNTSGTGLTALGYQALKASTGNNNTAVGYQAGFQVSSSTNNTLIGYGCSLSLTTGSNNTAIGSGCLFNSTTGTANVAVGASCKVGNTGSRNIVLGNDAGGTNINDCIVIGHGATATASNQFVVGSSSYNAGTVSTETNTSSQVWNVIINGVARKILLA